MVSEIPNKEYFEENGVELRIARMVPNERRKALWLVFNEDGVCFQNPWDIEPSLLPPVSAAIVVEFPNRRFERASNVSIGQQNERDIGKEYVTDTKTVYVTDNPRAMAMDENGDYGIGGSLAEAVYNTQLVIDLLEKFD